MLSEKYIAGFLDADGNIGVMWRSLDRKDTHPETKRAYLRLSFTQKTCQDEVLYKIREAIGGELYFMDRHGGMTDLKIHGRKAVAVLQRIRKHLVLKRHYANVCLDVAGKAHNRKEVTQYLKEQRRVKSLPLPNFPTRRWLAGYFDGDGSFQCRLPKNRTSAQIALQVAASAYDSEGLEIMHKAFGGSVHKITGREHLLNWIITLPPSKAIKVIGYFAKHLIIKKEQAYLILSCAKMGHYRDGKRIKATLKQLKTHPHRLSEPELGPRISDQWSIFDHKQCIECGETERPHRGHGRCTRCYYRELRRVKRQSDQAIA